MLASAQNNCPAGALGVGSARALHSRDAPRKKLHSLLAVCRTQHESSRSPRPPFKLPPQPTPLPPLQTTSCCPPCARRTAPTPSPAARRRARGPTGRSCLRWGLLLQSVSSAHAEFAWPQTGGACWALLKARSALAPSRVCARSGSAGAHVPGTCLAGHSPLTLCAGQREPAQAGAPGAGAAGRQRG